MSITTTLRASILFLSALGAGLAAAKDGTEARSLSSEISLRAPTIKQGNCGGSKPNVDDAKLSAIEHRHSWAGTRDASHPVFREIKVDMECMPSPMRQTRVTAFKSDHGAGTSASTIHPVVKLITWLTSDSTYTEGASHKQMMPTGNVVEGSAPHKRFNFKATFYRRAF